MLTQSALDGAWKRAIQTGQGKHRFGHEFEEGPKADPIPADGPAKAVEPPSE